MTNQTAGIAAKQEQVPVNKTISSKTVAHFEVSFHQVLDSEGNLTGDLPDFAKRPDNLIELYEIMVRTRVFDKKAIALQRRGQLGTYASSMGQEAIGAAAGSVMQACDVLLPTYREYAAQFSRGVTMTEILLYWGGNELGMDFKGARHDFPICVPIASQLPQAVGVAYAMKLRRQRRVAVCVFGDGATSKGDFYESINAAGAWNLPVVFIINNNQWAISMPRGQQSRAETLAQKAVAAGFSGEQVDGNDVVALRHRIGQAVDKARSDGGPTLIEALTYRLCDHTTADDASRYSSQALLAEQWRCEPLIRLRRYLRDIGCWSESKEKALLESVTKEVEDAVQLYLSVPSQRAESMFDYLYESLPSALEQQRQSVVERSNRDD